MAFASVVRAVEKSPLTRELVTKLKKNGSLLLNGIARLPKGIVASGLAKNSWEKSCSSLSEFRRSRALGKPIRGDGMAECQFLSDLRSVTL